jgi:hypothetical protein
MVSVAIDSQLELQPISYAPASASFAKRDSVPVCEAETQIDIEDLID